MGITLNYIILLLVLLVVAYLIYKYSKTPVKEMEKDLDEYASEEEMLTIDYLVNEVAMAAAKTLRMNPAEKNYTKDELERQQKRITDLMDSINRAAYGDPDAKVTIKEFIESFLTSEFAINTDADINKIIPFDAPDSLTGNDRMEILYHVYKKKLESKGKAKDALATIIEEFELDKPVYDKRDNLEYYVIDKDRMKAVYEEVMIEHSSKIVGDYELTLRDKQQILVQRVYEKWQGFDIIDIFYESAIDEIMCGVSGIPSTYRMPKTLANAPMSYESVWIVYRGIKLNFECLSFETYENYKRVLDNVYKFEAPYVVSKAQPGLQSTMEDGSRIVVARSPFASSDAIWLRKFDTAQATDLHWLFGRSANDFIPIFWIKWIIQCEKNLILTGGMGSGKTTALRACVKHISPQYAIGVYEKRLELNLNYTYPKRNIIAFQECDYFDEQAGIDFGKKTSRDVTIIGEIANKEQASYFVQTTQIASKLGLASHHASSTEALVDSIADNLLQSGIYSDKNDAVRAVSKVLNIDVHLENTRGNRHISRITEVVPLKDALYPSEMKENAKLSLTDKTLLDVSHYMMDQSKKQLYTTRDIIRWVPDDELSETGHYEFIQTPSKKMIAEMKMSLNARDRKEFEEGLELLAKAQSYYNKKEGNYVPESVTEIEQFVERIIA